MQKCATETPLALDRPHRDAQCGGGLLLVEPRKVTQHDDLGLPRVRLFEFLERIVEREDLVRGLLPGRLHIGHGDPMPVSAAFETGVLSRPIDEDSAHGLSGGPKDVPPGCSNPGGRLREVWM